tara:strand:+ start:162 stop:632 length:471 start_codon:yes stop_codon:yes gene_type:complete
MNQPATKLTEDLDISLVLPGQVSLIWKECEKILEKSCKRSGGRVSTMDLYMNCIGNKSSLWIIFEPDTMKIIGCAITQLHDYPTKLRMLNIEHVAGGRYEEWVDRGFKTLYKWAKDNKCDGIEAIGRAGFWNWIGKEKDWEETSRFYEFKFKDGDK